MRSPFEYSNGRDCCYVKTMQENVPVAAQLRLSFGTQRFHFFHI